jgi:hypothetical protein
MWYQHSKFVGTTNHVKAGTSSGIASRINARRVTSTALFMISKLVQVLVTFERICSTFAFQFYGSMRTGTCIQIMHVVSSLLY